MLENFGVGTDIVDINRFKKIPYSKKSSFYKKIFLPSEIKYCLKFKNSSQHFAGKFALKESVKKSIDKKISFLDIETYHKNSKPKIRLKNSQKYEFLASISHEKDYAVAVVVSQKLQK